MSDRVDHSARATIDWSDERQTIDGFGGSFAFHKAGSVQRLGEPLSTRVLDLVFDPEAGIGLDILRVVVGDGGADEWGDPRYDGPAETIEPRPGEFVWDRPDWAQRKHDFDAYQVWVMREAAGRGVRTILATVWSPPAWMKQNGSVISAKGKPAGAPEGPWARDPENRLRDDMYQAFADYLAEYVLGYEREFGIRITHVSPTNEPDLSIGYSSCQWTPEQLRVLVRDHLGPTFARRGVRASIVLGESVGFSEAHALPAITDPVANPYVDVVAAHAYVGLIDGATRAEPGAFATSRQLGKPIWQTEYMNQEKSNAPDSIDDGVRQAKLIGNLFSQTGLSGYLWWWPVANNASDGSDLIRLLNTGTPQAGRPTETGEYRVFKRYYAFGQYSRFIEAGDVMIGATREPSPGVLVTAYKNRATSRVAIVVVNDNETDVALTLVLTGGFPRVESVAGYRTSAEENLARLADMPVRDAVLGTRLSARSVTTFVA